MAKKYSEDDIVVYSTMEGLRKKVNMYLSGEDSDAMFQAFKEGVDNASDEISAGNDFVGVVLEPKTDAIWIVDRGRGIPVGKHKTSGKSTLTTIFTTVHSGGKMEGSKAYRWSAGTHGIGITVANAVSATLDVWTFRDKKWYHQAFAKGEPKTKVEASKKPKVPFLGPSSKGTVIRMVLDTSVFAKGSQLDKKRVVTFLSTLAYLHPEATFYYNDGTKQKEFHRPSGLRGFVANRIKKAAVDTHGEPFEFKSDNLAVHVQWTTSPDDVFASFANATPTSAHGTHMQGFQQALMEAFAKSNRGVQIKATHLMAGCFGVLNLMLPSTRYTTQTKEKLATKEAKAMVYEALIKPLQKWCKANPTVVKELTERAVALQDATEKFQASKKLAAELKTTKSGKSTLPAKLTVSTTKNNAERELFIVEGCFIGSTRIVLDNDNLIRFDALVEDWKHGIKHYGVARDIQNDCYVRAPLLEPRLTKTVTELQMVVLSNSQSFVCTPEHLWLLSDDTYVAANKLALGTPLKSMRGVVVMSSDTMQVSPTDVYDLTVEKYSNFMLEGGVFVHNSSASGTAKQARDDGFQEVLELTGKIPNVHKGGKDSGMDNFRILDILKSIGFDPKDRENFRTGRIVLLPDADVDGAHIATLLLGLFYKVSPNLFEQGRVMSVKGALFIYSNGKERIIADTYQEMQKKADKLKIKLQPKFITRAKGLGELSADVLRDLAFNPETRKLIRITAPEGKKAARQMIHMLGEDVSARKTLLGL